jgi:hypothetical protein
MIISYFIKEKVAFLLLLCERLNRKIWRKIHLLKTIVQVSLSENNELNLENHAMFSGGISGWRLELNCFK